MNRVQIFFCMVYSLCLPQGLGSNGRAPIAPTKHVLKKPASPDFLLLHYAASAPGDEQAPACGLERVGQDLVRGLERDSCRFGNRRRKRIQEHASGGIDLPAQQHCVVLMHGVVAMLHEHAAPVTELHGDGDSATLFQPVNIFAASLCLRNVGEAAVAGKDLPFFKVDVDWVVPVEASFEDPYLAGAELRRRRDPAEIGLERRASSTEPAAAGIVRRNS